MEGALQIEETLLAEEMSRHRPTENTSIIYLEVSDAPLEFPSKIPAFIGTAPLFAPKISFPLLLKFVVCYALYYGLASSLSELAALSYIQLNGKEAWISGIIDTGEYGFNFLDEELLKKYGLLNIWTP